MNEPKMEVIPAAALADEYPLLVQDVMDETLALFEENLAGRSIEVLNLQKIKVPSGGGPDFLIETAEGEGSARKTEGILLALRHTRIYFDRPYGSGGAKLPSCTSKDGFIGIGDPGGQCNKCPFAQFGTASLPDGSQGAGQACKQVVQVLFLLPGEKLPHLLNIPPTSSKAFERYQMQLISAGAPHWGVTTVLTLEGASNDRGVKYSKIHFHLGRRMDRAMRDLIGPYRMKMRELLIPSSVDVSTYEVVEEDPHRGAFAPREAPADPEAGRNPDDIPF